MRGVPLVVMLAACAKPGAALPDSGGSGSNGVDASTDAATDGTPADPFTTPVGAWTWVDLPGMTCGNGTPTGIGVNRSDTSTDVVVFFEGGGACWDPVTCFGLNAAVHLHDGYDANTLASELHYFPFDRTDPTDPLSTPTYIFVPYCTGDLHAGIKTMTYDVNGTATPVQHVGSINTQTMIDRVHAALPAAAHVWVVGQSAGGYGATLNFHRFAAAWPQAELSLFEDSSMFIPLAGNYGTWQSSWTLQYPPNCTNCANDFRAVVNTVIAAAPTSRIALTTYDNDTTIKLFFGYGLFDSIVGQVNSLVTTSYAGATTHVFELVGADHTMLGNQALTGAGGVVLRDWVKQWASGDPAWATVR